MIGKKYFWLFALPLLLHAEEMFHYNFAETPAAPFQLSGQAKISGGFLSLPDRRSELLIPNSGKFNFAKNGTTLMMTCRFIGRAGGTPPLQLLASKDESFFLAVFNNKFNFSLSQKGEWPIALIAGTPPADGQWFHLAAVVRPDVEIEQGKNGIQLEIYINGNRLSKFADVPELYPNPETPIRLGLNGGDEKSETVVHFGKNSGFIGDIAEVSMIDRALSPMEIADALKQSKLVKNLRPGFVEIDPALEVSLAKLQQSADSPHAKFAAQALANAAATGANRAAVEKSLAAVTKMVRSGAPEETFIAQWNMAQKTFQLVATERLLTLIHTGSGAGVYPVIGVYDRQAKRAVSAGKFNSWKLESRDLRNRPLAVSDSSAGVNFTVSPIKYRNGNAYFTIVWQTPDFTVTSNCIQSAARLEQDLRVENPGKNRILNHVIFPNWQLSRLPGQDTLFFPQFSGRLYRFPVREGVNLDTNTGNASDNMQFRAYYSDDGFGTYLAMEDPVSDYRRASVLGMYGELGFSWNNLVPYSAVLPAGNSYTQSGKAVLELFTGDWFDASMIYKNRFLPHAKWWIPELPRTSTPKWFRELPATILVGTFPPRGATVVERMRAYLDVPISAHLVGWSANGRIWPHFDEANEHGKEFLERMKKHDVKVIPYSDSVIFSVLDGADKKSDREYKSIGYPASVKRRDGKPYLRRYGTASAAIVCPGSALWRNYYLNIVNSIARMGFNGAYHDQECSCRIDACYDPKHEFHDLNDPSVWVLKGHMPMFEIIRREAAEINSEFVHTGEDAADPFLQILDGFTVWRFTDQDHVPAFQAVYAGRIQFSGRTFNHQKPGDWDSSFIKFAEQLAYAEQLGWITIEDLEVATPLRLYFKKLCHLRLALIRYLTEASMLKPYSFDNMQQITSTWGDANTPHRVTTDQIIHSSWQLPDGRIMTVFLNTMEHSNTVKIRHSFGKNGVLAICREGSKAPEYADPSAPPEIRLAPYASEIWLYSPRDNREEAEKISAVMDRISRFDMGEDFFPPDDSIPKNPKTITLVPGDTLYTNRLAGYTQCRYKYPRSGAGIPQGMLHTYDGSELFLRKLNFSAPVKSVEITAAATGITHVELFSVNRNGSLALRGKVQLKSGKQWMEMHNTVIELSDPLQGGENLVLKFKGDSTRFKSVTFR